MKSTLKSILLLLLLAMTLLIVGHMLTIASLDHKITMGCIVFRKPDENFFESSRSVEFTDVPDENLPVDPVVVENSRALLNPNCARETTAKEQDEFAARMSDAKSRERLRNCDNYFRTMPIAAMEDVDDRMRVRLAFSHQVHKEIVLLEAMLSVIFRPWNVHCVHVDRKASEIVHETVRALAKCYNDRFGSHSNPEPVHVLANPEAVFWGHISVLKADLRCLEHSLQNNGKWTHFVNLAGTELPTKPYSHLEEVVALAPPGVNILESYPLPRKFQDRILIYYNLMRFGAHKYDLQFVRGNFNMPPPPFGLKIFKGMKNVIITRSFSKFVLNDPVALKFFYWLEDVSVSDEFFFQTLATITNCSSTHCDQNMSMNTTVYGMPRYTLWREGSTEPCYGQWIRDICNFAMRDLAKVREARGLIANKFNLEVDSKAPLCHWKSLRNQQKTPNLV